MGEVALGDQFPRRTPDYFATETKRIHKSCFLSPTLSSQHTHALDSIEAPFAFAQHWGNGSEFRVFPLSHQMGEGWGEGGSWRAAFRFFACIATMNLSLGS